MSKNSSDMDELLAQTKDLSSMQKRAFMNTFSSAMEFGKSEKDAFRIALAATDGVSKREIKVSAHTRGDGTKVEEHTRRLSGSSDADDDADWKEIAKNVAITTAIAATPVVIGAVAIRVNTRSFESLHNFMRKMPLFKEETKLWTQQPSIFPMTFYSPSSYRGLQGRNYQETLTNVERAMKGRKFENSFIINKTTGKIEAAYAGTQMNVPMAFPQGMRASKRNNYVMTHNHPVEVPLSGPDLDVLAKSNFGEIRAVLPSGTVSSVTNNGTISSRLQIKRSVKQHNESARKMFTDTMNADEMMGMQLGIGDSFADWLARGTHRNDYWRMVVDNGWDQFSGGVNHQILTNVVKRVGDVNKNSSYDEDMDELRIEGSIAKVDDEKRQVFGWASVTEINGDPVVDLQGDLMETYELEKAAYDYVLNSRVGGEMHQRVGKSSPRQVGTLIESMVITPEKIEKMGLPPETPHGWWIGFQVGRDDFGDKAWDKVKKGDYTGFSIHGLGKRQSVDKMVRKGVMTRETSEYLAWLEKISGVSGITPKQIDQDLRGWMQSEGVDDPGDDDIHDFLTTAYGSGEEEVVDKHFVEFFKSVIQIPAHERAGVTVRAHTRNLGQRAKEASGQAQEMAQRFYNESKPKEKVMAGAYTTISVAAAGLAGSYARHGSPKTALLYGAYGLASAALAGFTVNDVLNPEGDVKKNLSELDDATQELADALGVEPAQLLEDLGDWMGEQKELTVEDMTEFIRDTYGNDVVKHLIGRHEQKDHDPTKGKSDRSHAREDHSSESTSTGAAIGGLAGLVLGGPLGGAAGGLVGAQAGSQSGAKDRASERQKKLFDEKLTEIERDLDKWAKNNNITFPVGQGLSDVAGNLSTSTGDKEIDQLLVMEALEMGEDPDQYVRSFTDFNNARQKTSKALIYKAAEKAKSQQEFADNVEEIGKALVDHDPEMAGYFEDVHKHLIGRHEQDDHDPTKKGRGGHSRDQHKGKSPTGANRNPGQGAAIGAGAMGVLAGGMAARFGLGGAARYAAQGAAGGSAMGYQLGGGQIFGNPNDSRLGGVAAGTGNLLVGGNLGIVPGIRRLAHGDPNAMYNQQRQGKSNRKLNKRQIEVLEKYLGKNVIEEI